MDVIQGGKTNGARKALPSTVFGQRGLDESATQEVSPAVPTRRGGPLHPRERVALFERVSRRGASPTEFCNSLHGLFEEVCSLTQGPRASRSREPKGDAGGSLKVQGEFHPTWYLDWRRASLP